MPDVPLTFRRRDLIEAEKVAQTPAGKLFLEDENGDRVATALGNLAMQYVLEKRNGLVDVDFDTWLDEEPDDIEVESADPS